MNKNKNNLISILAIVIGTILLVSFVGKYVIPIIAAIIGLLLINFGLENLGLPRLQNIFYQFINQIIHMFRR